MMFIRKVDNGYLVEDTANSKISVFSSPVEMLSFVQSKLQDHLGEVDDKQFELALDK